jgi:hypothetical protein
MRPDNAACEDVVFWSAPNAPPVVLIWIDPRGDADEAPALYCGTLRTPPEYVAAPLDPEVVRLKLDIPLALFPFPEYGPPPLYGPLSACADAPNRQTATAMARKRGRNLID